MKNQSLSGKVHILSLLFDLLLLAKVDEQEALDLELKKIRTGEERASFSVGSRYITFTRILHFYASCHTYTYICAYI